MDLEFVRDKIVQYLSKRETAHLRFLNKFNSKIPLTIDLTFLPKRVHTLIGDFILEDYIGSDSTESESEFAVCVTDCTELANCSTLHLLSWRSSTWHYIYNA